MKHKLVTMACSRTGSKPLQTALSDRKLVFKAAVAKSALPKCFHRVSPGQSLSPEFSITNLNVLTQSLRIVALVTVKPKPQSLTLFAEKNQFKSFVVLGDVLPMLESLANSASSSFSDRSHEALNHAAARETVLCQIS